MIEDGGWKTQGAGNLRGLRSFSAMVVRINSAPKNSDLPPRGTRGANWESGMARRRLIGASSMARLAPAI